MHRSIKEHPAYNDLIRQIKANDTRLRTPTRHGPSPRYDEWYQLLKHKQDLLYMQLEVWDELDLCYKYDPNQPRVPAGNSGGGQWTDAGGGIDPVVTGATLAQSASKPATGSWTGRAEQIAREIDRNTPLRAIVRSNPVIRSVTSLLSFLKTPELEYPLADAVQQYNAIAAADDPYVVPLLSLRAKQFTKGDSDTKIWASVREVDRETFSKFCPNYFTVQTQAEMVANTMGPMRLYGTPQNYGNQFHARLAVAIRLLNNPNLHAEYPIWKPGANVPDSLYDEPARRGASGTILPDIYEEVSTDTLCLYDAKTGPTELSHSRMELFSRGMAKTKPGVRYIFIMEVRTGPAGER